MNRNVLRALAPILVAARRTEQIARDVSLGQAKLAPLPSLQHALREQSKQEATHARAFETALELLGEGRPPERMLVALDAFGRRLDADLIAGRLACSMFGLQYVLEGLGGVALSPPAGHFAQIGDKFVPLRDLVLHQEIAHRRLGEVWVPRLAAHLGEDERSELATASREYVELAAAVVEAGLPLLEDLEADRNHYMAAAGSFLESLDLERLLMASRVSSEAIA
ncbi:MAG: hypothetical protein HYX47_11970 [Burkholderiales bacterium]|nr:hypothetical protein [Burkholderiales bacterium]